MQLAVLELTANYSVYQTTPGTIAHATRLAQRYQLEWFDALIVAAALECGCTTPYSEDLQAGQRFDGQLTVASPFVT